MTCPEGPHKKVKIAETGLGHMPLLMSMDRVHLGSQTGLVNSNQKCEILVSPSGVLSKGHIRHTGTQRQGRQLITRTIEESHQGITSACGSAASI